MLDAKYFAPDTIEERTVKLGDGTEHVLYFKHLPNTAFERYAMWMNSEDEAIKAAAHAHIVALGLCEPDGKQSMTTEQAERVKRPVLLRLLATLLEVNDYGEKKKATDEGKA